MDTRLILSIQQHLGSDVEEIILTEGVHAEGAIEAWLNVLEAEMQTSVRDVCKSGLRDCISQDLSQFVAYQSQVALLGVQMLWTTKVEEALMKNPKERHSEMGKK